MKPIDYDDRRHSKRRPLKKGTAVECRKGTLGLGRNTALDKKDVSEEGIQLVVSSAFKPGDEIEIQLTAPGMSKPMGRVAEVVWCAAREDGTFIIGARMRKAFAYAEIIHCI